MLLTINIHFRTPQENWHKYPAWLLLCIHEIIAPVIALSAVAMKILMKKEMKQYLFGNSVHPVHEWNDIELDWSGKNEYASDKLNT